MAKKKTTKAAEAGELNEKTSFIPDNETTNEGKNTLLAAHLNGVWNPLAIVQINRIEIGPQPGWMARHRV